MSPSTDFIVLSPSSFFMRYFQLLHAWFSTIKCFMFFCVMIFCYNICDSNWFLLNCTVSIFTLKALLCCHAHPILAWQGTLLTSGSLLAIIFHFLFFLFFSVIFFSWRGPHKYVTLFSASRENNYYKSNTHKIREKQISDQHSYLYYNQRLGLR